MIFEWLKNIFISNQFHGVIVEIYQAFPSEESSLTFCWFFIIIKEVSYLLFKFFLLANQLQTYRITSVGVQS